MERLKELRNALNLTQAQFAERLNLSRNYIAQAEVGLKTLSDRTFKDICREFNVNPVWLLEGKEEMFVKVTPDEELMAYIAETIKLDEGDIRKKILRAMAKLDLEDWKKVNDLIDKIVETKEKGCD